ncbi:Hypothetical predicted protein [Cloeon dipterum]|uniref:Uncharacterized protein n=1 Tax=Cloeon dipterum TaxID=197152 RepID=A0A8S1CZ55_9INSE|nr:Hypothetical predicted protein [Cloeon dipterum]
MDILCVRTLGENLKSLVGRNVVLMGFVQSVHSSNSSINLRTTDQIIVNVTFPDSLPDAPTGYIQVWGSVENQCTVNAEDYWQFTSEQPFDEKSYNGAVQAMTSLKDYIHSPQS